jgi:predicted amidohydrolase
MAVVTVATCQFPVSADIGGNLHHVARQLRLAKDRGADVAHFPEGALSGYACSDFDSFHGFDWAGLRDAADQVLELAAHLGIWVVLGSAHRLTGDAKPHNSLYVVSDRGELVDRYDKRFLAGDPDGSTGELAHYSPGDHASTWEINGVRCGALICYEYRYPELHRGYCRDGVQLLFHSFHAANASTERLTAIGARIGPGLAALNAAPTFTYPAITMPAAMTAVAAADNVWISCPNSSAVESLWPSFFVRADGVTVGRLRRNRAGVLISTVDTTEDLYHSTAAWRERALTGVLHSGTLVSDPRSADRTSL